MLRKMTKILSVIVTAALLLSTLGVVVFAGEGVTEKTFTDDFSSYTVENAKIGEENAVRGTTTGDTVVAEKADGCWKRSDVSLGWVAEGNQKYGLKTYINPTTETLFIDDEGSTHSSYVNLYIDDLIEVNSISFDMKRDDSGRMGVRFNPNSNETSYYELSVGGWGDGGLSNYPYFKKVVDGGAVYSESSQVDVSQMPQAWYNIQISIDNANGEIAWSVYRKSDSLLVWSSSYTDFAMLTYSSAAVLQLGGSCGWIRTSYDNVSVGYSAVYVDPTSSFSDNFSSYTAANARIGEENAVRGTSAENTEIAIKEGGIWKRSNVFKGWITETRDGMTAYIDSGLGALFVNDEGASNESFADLILTDGFIGVKALSLDMKTSQDGRFGVRFNMSADGRDYYEISIGGWNDGALARKPYFKKVADGGAVATQTGSFVRASGSQSWYHVTVAINDATIAWTVTNKENAAQTWSDSFTDGALLPQSTDIALSVGGSNGWVSAYFDNVAVWTVTPPPTTFSDNFSSYTAANAKIGAENAVRGTSAENTEIAIKKGGIWKRSDIFKGWITETKDGMTAYVDSGLGALFVNDEGSSNESFADLMLTDGFIGVKALSLDMKTSQDGRFGVRFNMSADGRDYYEISIGGWNDGALGWKPYFKKVADGGAVATQTGSFVRASGSQSWYHVTVAINDATIAWTVTNKENAAQTWSDSFTDGALLPQSTDIALSVGGSSGWVSAYFDNVGVLVTSAPAWEINSEGDLEVTLVPNTVSGQPFVVIVAFYNSANQMLSVQTQNVEDITGDEVTLIYDNNATAGRIGKIFIWNSLEDPNPITGPLDID